MKLDRIVIDFLQWIKEQFWKTPTHSPVYLFDEIERFDSQRGYLKRVRRDTLREVATWVFVPKRNIDLDNITSEFKQHQFKDYRYDLYICCDHLYPLTEIESPKRKQQQHKSQKKEIYNPDVKTHKISVFWLSHFLKKDGSFESIEVFSQDYCMVKRGALDHHLEARAIVRSVAILLKYRPIEDDFWHSEIEISRRQFLGTSFTPTVRDNNSLFTLEEIGLYKSK